MAAEHELAARIRHAAPQRGQPYTIGRPASDDAAHVPTLVALSLIDDNPFQPRTVYDDERIAAIAASITAHGLLQIPIARFNEGTGRYQLAFGHSRLRAFQHLAATDAARFGQMPLLIRDLDDETMALHAWTENKDRKDLSVYDEARAIARYTQTFGWTQQQAADKLKLDRSTIANKLRLLKLPRTALEHLAQGRISERQAMALLPLAELPQAAMERGNLQIWIGILGAYLNSATELITKAPQFDSATLRKLVEALLGKLTIPLEGADWATVALPDHTSDDRVRAACCTDCPIRLKASNRCPDAACATGKQQAYAVQLATTAAARVGLPAAAPRPYGEYDNLDGLKISAVKQTAKETSCGNLKVVQAARGYYPHGVSGYPDCSYVCDHGPRKTCACRRALTKSADPDAARKVAERQQRQRIKTDYLAPTVAALTQALESPASHRALLWQLAHYTVRKHADQERAKQAPDQLPAILAAALAREATKYDLEYGVNEAGAKKHLAAVLAAFGLPIPWDTPQE
jgi:ParB/RepB/Spo0J family partition protein